MGIDLSLYLTQAEESLGYAGDDALRLASCRATMPVSWWCFFAPEEIIEGPYGPMMRAQAADVLPRIRAQAPRLRAAAGRHARGLRRIERVLEEHPDWWLEAYISELYYGCSLESLRHELTQAQARLGLGTLWVSLKQGRFIRDEAAPTQQLSDHIVGPFEPPLEVVMSWERFVERCNDALGRGDASELDLLEEALYLQQREQLGAFDKIIDAIEPRRYVNPMAIAESAALLDRWADGDQAALGGLSSWQLSALEEAAKHMPYELSRKLRSRLRKSVEPVEGLIARALRIACPMSETLSYVLWERGDQPPISAAHARAVMACRLVATGAPASPLCLYDPLAIAERAAFSTYYASPVIIPSPLEIALSRALRLTKAEVAGWLSRYPQLAMGHYDETPYEIRLSAALCKRLSTRELSAHVCAQLRAIEEPPEAALCGTARQLVLLALGEESCLEPLLEATDVDRNRLIASIYASRLLTTTSSIRWIKAQLLEPDALLWESPVLAWVLLCEAGEQDTAIQALHKLRLEQLAWHVEAYHEGLISEGERRAYEDLLRTLRETLRDKQAPTELIDRLDAALEWVESSTSTKDK